MNSIIKLLSITAPAHLQDISDFSDKEYFDVLMTAINEVKKEVRAGNGIKYNDEQMKNNKANYYSMLVEDISFSVNDWNDHYFQAEDEFNVKVTGIVSIKINTKNLDLTDISKLEEAKFEDYFHDIYSEAEVNIESIEDIELI